MIEIAERKPGLKVGLGPLVLALALVVLATIGPLLDSYLLHIMILIYLYAYLGASWNILSGYAGQFSFGHATFFGVGAYTSTLLFMNWGISPWIGLLASGLVSMAFGLLIGFLSFRYGLRGVYFALVTLAFAEMLRVIIVNSEWANRAQGLLIPTHGNAPWLFQFTGRLPYYYISLLMLVLITMLTHFIERSKWGYYFIAIRENEAAAEAIGVNAFAYKMVAIAISSFLTALGGSYYAQYFFYIEPYHTFGVITSVDILLRAIIGGSGTVLGPIAGSFILTPLSELTRNLFRGISGVDIMIFGAVLILVVIFLPHGLVGLWHDLAAKFRSPQKTGK